jgi:hypothetical protein
MANVNADFNQSGNSVFENVYITGSLDYDFSNDDLTIRKDINKGSYRFSRFFFYWHSNF